MTQAEYDAKEQELSQIRRRQEEIADRDDAEALREYDLLEERADPLIDELLRLEEEGQLPRPRG